MSDLYLEELVKRKRTTMDSSLFFTGDDSADYTSVMKFTTLIGAREVDAVIATKEEFESYVEMDAFVPMEELLTEEEYRDFLTEYLGYLTVKVADYVKSLIIDNGLLILAGPGGEEDGEDGL